MYHAACKVEFQPFKRSYSQLTSQETRHRAYPVQATAGKEYNAHDKNIMPLPDTSKYILVSCTPTDTPFLSDSSSIYKAVHI